MNNFRTEDLKSIEAYVRRYVENLPILNDTMVNRDRLLAGIMDEVNNAQNALGLILPKWLVVNVVMKEICGTYKCFFSWDIH